MSEPPTLAELQHEKSVLERERDSITEAIRELRARARKKSLEASATRQPLPESEIAFWREGIARHQTALMAAQGKLASVNKELRKAKAEPRFRSLSQLPPEVSVKEEPDGALNSDGAGIQAPGGLKEGHVLFLQFFRQLVVENIDPRLVKVFEKDAHSLVSDHRRMHQEKS